MVAKSSRENSAGPVLHARTAGSGAPVLLLHGLFGAGSNLGALQRHLQDSYSVSAVDLPGHGRSPWLSGYSLASMAEAVVDWLAAELAGPVHLVGHSLGGKVAMQIAMSAPRQVASLVVADIAPVKYAPGHDEVFAGLKAVADGDCTSRNAARELLDRHIDEEGVVDFLLASLARDDSGTYRWRFDVRGLRHGYGALSAAPQDQPAWAGPVLFVKGERSGYLRKEHREAITHRFPAAELKVMQGCGHWLHAEKPQLFNRLVHRFIVQHDVQNQERQL